MLRWLTSLLGISLCWIATETIANEQSTRDRQVSAPTLTLVETVAFPKEVQLNSRHIAHYKVINSSQTDIVNVINDTQFPAGSGYRMESTTCIGPIAPTFSCELSIMFKAMKKGLNTAVLKLRADPSGATIENPWAIQVN